jgi:2-amino-4-hydroxy-6-hydroxymethyldihydropteridine diphosphokinase
MHLYLLALGSNRMHGWAGRPREVIGEAIAAMEGLDCSVDAVSRVIESAPIGPARRRFANAAALVRTPRDPAAMLTFAKLLESAFGRRPAQSWSDRVLDIDIVLWDGGMYADDRLAIPHTAMRDRPFVLGPAAQIAPDWRDPVTGLTIAQLHARLTAPRALTRPPNAPGVPLGGP